MGRQRGMSYDAPSTYAALIAPRYAAIGRALVDAARLRRRDAALELGAGTGVVTRLAAPRVRTLVATDVSEPMLAHARAAVRGAPGLSFALVDYTQPRLPFLSSSFDVVLSGLTFVQDSAPALREVVRVLKPGGRLALSMWGSSYHEKRVLNDALTAIGGGRFPRAAPGRVVRRLERLGFEPVERVEHEISNRFDDVDAYLAYRRGFGVPAAWTPAYYERFLRAVRTRALDDAAADGSFTLGWVQEVVTARLQA
ncbi:MAG TPA: methyltransferase domain-containing protein [Gaiellaceae bacterium]